MKNKSLDRDGEGVQMNRTWENVCCIIKKDTTPWTYSTWMYLWGYDWKKKIILTGKHSNKLDYTTQKKPDRK